MKESSSLCSKSILLLVVVAALDSADKSLLSASFPVLERTLNLDIEALGYFSLFSNVSYALALPFWGWLLHELSMKNAHNILAGACLLWGIATLGIALSGSSWVGQAIFRSLNGASLASILPLSQSMIAELVPAAMRGRAFGLIGLAEKTAAFLAVSAAVYCDTNWKLPYLWIGLLSIMLGFGARVHLRVVGRSGASLPAKKIAITFRRVAQKPAFLCLVGQGVFGAVPWDMMSYLLLLYEWKGLTKEQVVTIQFVGGVAGALGGGLGGVLGDWFYHHHRLGRIGIAFVSVIGGALFYGLFLYAQTFYATMVWYVLFQLWGTWTTAAANRPLCAEMSPDPSERAQIVAAWLLLEKTSAAVLGAPLVGYITKRMMQSVGDSLPPAEKAHTLAFNMMWLSFAFWGMCAFFWVVMASSLARLPLSLTQSESETKPLL